MRKQDNLQQLIAGLNPNEKRYFKLFSNIQPGDKQYLELFDALDESDNYDTKALCAKLDLTTGQLATNKFYLNQSLLKCLRHLDEPAWKHPQLYKNVIDINNLASRGMHEVALTLIDKTLVEARHFESYAHVVALLTAKQRALVSLRKIDEVMVLNAEWLKEVEAHLEFIELFLVCIQCEKLEHERKNAGEVKAILEHPALKKDPDALLSVKAASCWFNTYQRAYNFLGENEKTLHITRRMIAYFQAHRQYLDIDARGYIFGHISLAQVECFNGNYAECLELLDKIEPFLTKPPKYLVPEQIEDVRFYIRHTQQHVMRITGRYEESVHLGREVYRTKDTRAVFEQYSFIYDFAVALLQTGNSKEAYQKLDELLQMGDDVRADLQLYVRPGIILAQMEMEHFELIPHLIKSTKAWMKRKNLSNAGLDVFFHHAYAIAKAPVLHRQNEWQRFIQAVENGEMKDFDDQMRSLSCWLTKQQVRKAVSV